MKDCDPALDYVQTAAWSGLMHWLIDKKDVIEQFELETGIKCPSQPKTILEKMIDEQCGHDPMGDFVKAFIPWATENYWGLSEVTPTIRKILKDVGYEF